VAEERLQVRININLLILGVRVVVEACAVCDIGVPEVQSNRIRFASLEKRAVNYDFVALELYLLGWVAVH